MRRIIMLLTKLTYTSDLNNLPLHDALPIWSNKPTAASAIAAATRQPAGHRTVRRDRRTAKNINASAEIKTATRFVADRKITRLNSSHLVISYDVFCLKKKNIIIEHHAQLIM